MDLWAILLLLLFAVWATGAIWLACAVVATLAEGEGGWFLLFTFAATVWIGLPFALALH